MITIKSRREFSKMQKAGAAVAAIHEAVRATAAPGVSLLDLEEISARILKERGCRSSFLGYHGTYPATLCLSPNDIIVHGIPSSRRLEEGDILSVDAGAIFEGFHGDAAFTMPIGEVSEEAQRLIEVTEEALWAGIRQVRKGNHLGDIGAVIAEVGEGNGFGVVEEYVGHGIGRQMHEEPAVPNFGRAGTGMEIKPGLVVAIEPMVNLGGWPVETRPDGWTIVTKDGTVSAHFEHTVAATEEGPVVLTRR